ncbi:hypothetical protein VKT23_010467 [Stygiomarasmius scandens]|uniref:F-box domain-containing protein n=1 Tax=Marasmiellus scandens TaxID=2682957 RepID=A0ABR1JCC8_9AGAR
MSESETPQAFPVFLHKLPTELISEIFILYQDTHRTEEDEFRESITFRPASQYPLTTFTLGSVCRLWHSITISTARLWSRFLIEVGPRCLLQVCHRLQLHVSRSKQLPLSFDVRFEDGWYDLDDGPPPEFRSAFCILVNESHRWSHVCWDLWAATTKVRSFFGVNRDINLSVLRMLAIKGFVDDDDNLFAMFGRAFALQKLVVEGVTMNKLNVHMNHLHHLCISGIMDDRGILFVIKKLADCFPTLRTLDLDVDDVPVNVMEDGIQELCFERLEDLRLKPLTWFETITIFSLFTLPSLRKMTLVSSYHSLDGVEDPHFYARTGSVMTSFLSRSTCPLSALEIIGINESDGLCVISSMLKSMPSLTELRLHETQANKPIDDHDSHPTSIMQALCVPRASVGGTHQEGRLSQSQNFEPILPNLQNLDLLIDTDRPGFDSAALAEMISSRCTHDTCADNARQSCCLRRVKVAVLSKTSQPSLTLLQNLELLKNAGMPIEL